MDMIAELLADSTSHSGNKGTRGYDVLPQGMLDQGVDLDNAIAYPGLDIKHLVANEKPLLA